MKRIDFYSKSLRNKLFSILIIAALSVGISWGLSYIAFNKVVASIDEVSKPNYRIQLINDLSYSFSSIVQFQRKHFLEKGGEIQFPDNLHLLNTLDTLRRYYAYHPDLIKKIDSMEVIISNYDSLLTNYLDLYTEFIDFRKLSSKYNSLTDYISAIASEIDSSVITTETKVTTTTIYPDTLGLNREENKPTFLQRLFGSRSADELYSFEPDRIPQKIVKEELNTRVDTLKIAQREKLVRDFEASVHNIDRYQRLRSIELANSELILVNHTNSYINQLRTLLKAIEDEEMKWVGNSNARLIGTVNESMSRMTYIMLIFVILSTILAFLVFSDISRSNQYRKELTLAKEEAEYLSQVKQRFLSNMSHEIRTPLQSIVGFSEQVMNQPQPDKDALKVIHNSSKHLAHIVNEVLDYSRITSGKFSLDRLEFNMYELLDEVSEAMKFQASSKGLQLIFQNNLDPNANYFGDPFRLKQILYNLLGNAVKFTYKGEITLKVNYIVSSEESKFSFSVEDTGIGISQDDLPVIFNEFEQAGSGSASHRQSGTGLGLNITKALIELQGGELQVKSELGKGSVFSFLIRYENSKASHYSVTSPEDLVRPDFSGKVMVIDDDIFILKLCSYILKKYGIIHSCYSLPYEALLNLNPDVSLILMDIRMPEINGFELFDLFKAKGGKDLKIIALSAHTLAEERAAIRNKGFNELLIKPFKEHDFFTVVNRYLKRKDYNSDMLQSSPLVEMSMGDPSLLAENLKSFLYETKQDVISLKDYVQRKKVNDTLDILHKLAGRVGQVGAKNLSGRLLSFEQEIKKKNHFVESRAKLNDISKEVEMLIEKVERETFSG
jgi:signal transduction histidine kinase/CheY-like chemotaxis protein/HPt (histidine-containing phosphotransfer) domain-containing protein